MNSIHKLSTTVWYERPDGQFDRFLVSTIERDSSAAIYPPPRYHETIVWTLDANMVRGDIVAHVGDGPCIKQHMKMCEAFYVHGKFEEPDKESDEESEKVRLYVQDDEGKRHGPYDDYEEAKIDADRIDGIIVR